MKQQTQLTQAICIGFLVTFLGACGAMAGDAASDAGVDVQTWPDGTTTGHLPLVGLALNSQGVELRLVAPETGSSQLIAVYPDVGGISLGAGVCNNTTARFYQVVRPTSGGDDRLLTIDARDGQLLDSQALDRTIFVLAIDGLGALVALTSNGVDADLLAVDATNGTTAVIGNVAEMFGFTVGVSAFQPSEDRIYALGGHTADPGGPLRLWVIDSVSGAALSHEPPDRDLFSLDVDSNGGLMAVCRDGADDIGLCEVDPMNGVTTVVAMTPGLSSLMANVTALDPVYRRVYQEGATTPGAEQRLYTFDAQTGEQLSNPLIDVTAYLDLIILEPLVL